MKRTLGRPPAKVKTIKMTFRFKPEFAEFIRSRSNKNRSPRRVIEIALTLAGKEIN